MTQPPADIGSSFDAGDEASLWRSLREHADETARCTLIGRYMPFAKMIAAMVYGQRINRTDDFDDYLQLARVGLLEAMDRFDPARGVQFKTFAARSIRGSVLDGIVLLTEQHGQAHARARALAARTESVSHQGESAPGQDLFKYLADVGMGLALGFMLEGTGLVEVAGLHSATGPDPMYGAVELKQARRRLHGLIGDLPPQERKVIHHHYLQGLPFEEVADAMGLTKGRISQIHRKALVTLRDRMAEHHVCDRSF